ncbi:glycosyltransferase family 1 protein [Halonotius terrestris]|uniref:Glycosyltransferase family 1 protein n=1 Tax=Halonotius terrestris TaxID=2487750 RepID=A0A8J8TDB9_9EURY|nr:glycosyltransferase family 1 protein [Halonotius terrestris]TQQ83366.1 glycosyltransferase family 1 protein [Halonotius terrestris]
MTVRIGVNARTFTEAQPGGAVQAAMKLTRTIHERRSVELLLFGHESIRTDFPDIPVVSNYYFRPTQSFGVAWERTVLPWLAKHHDIDVLFCPNGNSPLTPQPYPVVTCIHDVNALNGFTNGLHSLYRKATVPIVARISDHIVTVSSFSKSEIVDKLDVQSDTVSVVYNGVDDFYYGSDNYSTIDVPKRYILYVGSVNYRKNISRAIEAFTRFANDSAAEYKFVLVGPRNKSIFNKLNISEDDRIVSLGFLSQPELKFVYTNAAVLLYPSLYEGFGLPPLEAMACGTPVIVSNTTSFPEIIGDAGEQVDPHDVDSIASGIDAVLSDSHYRQQLIERGRNRSFRFKWNRSAEQLLDVIENTTSEKQ